MKQDETVVAKAELNPRAHMLAALLEAFPPTPSVPYGRDSARYRKLYGANPKAETQGMFVFRTSMVMRKWRSHIDDQLKRRGHSLAVWQTLFELAANKPTENLKSISARVGLAPPTLVTLVHELESNGFLERRSDPADRRSKIIVLTAKGEELVDELFGLLRAWRDDFLRGIEDSEIQLMLDMVNRMSANLDLLTEEK